LGEAEQGRKVTGTSKSIMSKEQWDAIRGVVNKVIVPTGAVLGVFAALFVGITYTAVGPTGGQSSQLAGGSGASYGAQHPGMA
jgi:hypothetical protein